MPESGTALGRELLGVRYVFREHLQGAPPRVPAETEERVGLGTGRRTGADGRVDGEEPCAAG